MTDKEKEIYIDWVNNFLTVSAFAAHYGMTTIEAEDLIARGRQWFRNKDMLVSTKPAYYSLSCGCTLAYNGNAWEMDSWCDKHGTKTDEVEKEWAINNKIKP